MLTEIFCELDDFCIKFKESLIGLIPSCRMFLSEIMTILVSFHLSGYRTFKNYYHFIKTYQLSYFPNLLSYNRIVELIPSCAAALTTFLLKMKKGENTGISFIDSTKLVVSHNKRIPSHKVFKTLAKRSKDSVGWYYGFKLHLLINHLGEIISFRITPANIDERVAAKDLVRFITGKVYADKGYVSAKLKSELKNVDFVARPKNNMLKNQLSEFDKCFLRKRALIETVNEHLKHVCQVEHSRHRSIHNFFVHVISAITAYSFIKNKPSIGSIPLPNKNLAHIF